jgi:hypothetical protein
VAAAIATWAEFALLTAALALLVVIASVFAPA